MDELIRWLLAQVDEDERVANECVGVNSRAKALGGTPIPRWHWAQPETSRLIQSESGLSTRNMIPRAETWGSEGEHIIRHDPSRVLRKVKAIRQIIELCATETDETGGKPLAVRTLRLLASEYDDRPGYQESWRP